MGAILEHVLLSEPKINNVYFRTIFWSPCHKIIRLYVAVEVTFVVYELDSFNHLKPDHHSCFQVESAPVAHKQIFQGGAEQIHHHYIILSLASRVIHSRNAVVS